LTFNFAFYDFDLKFAVRLRSSTSNSKVDLIHIRQRAKIGSRIESINKLAKANFKSESSFPMAIGSRAQSASGRILVGVRDQKN